MTTPVVVRPEAEAELAEAFAWYEQRAPGLGAQFVLAVEAVLGSISRNIRQYPVVHGGIRRALLRRFPYQVFYLAKPDCVVVLAVFHAHREPRHWQERR